MEKRRKTLSGAQVPPELARRLACLGMPLEGSGPSCVTMASGSRRIPSYGEALQWLGTIGLPVRMVPCRTRVRGRGRDAWKAVVDGNGNAYGPCVTWTACAELAIRRQTLLLFAAKGRRAGV